ETSGAVRPRSLLGLWSVREYLSHGRHPHGSLAMTSIDKILAVPAVGAGYYEDLAALQAEQRANSGL
ncbi:unnamed protein product, partial [marine sediment metagenome]